MYMLFSVLVQKIYILSNGVIGGVFLLLDSPPRSVTQLFTQRVRYVIKFIVYGLKFKDCFLLIISKIIYIISAAFLIDTYII